MERHEKLVQLGIVFSLHHEILGMGHLALYRRDQFYAYFDGPGWPVGDRGPPRGPGQLSGECVGVAWNFIADPPMSLLLSYLAKGASHLRTESHESEKGGGI